MNVDDFLGMSREEKDEYAKKLMDEMKQKNERIKKRHAEVEEDRLRAEARNAAVTSSKTSKKKQVINEREKIVDNSRVTRERVWDKGKIDQDSDDWSPPRFPEHRSRDQRRYFQRGQIVGAHLAGASVAKTSQFLEVSSNMGSKIMTAYTHCSKTSLTKQNIGQKENFSIINRWVLQHIVTSKMLTTAAKVTTELYQYLDSLVSIITIKSHLLKQNIYGRGAFTKPLVTNVNAKCCLQ
ncbi:uncharacterized protein TNCV_2880661 [Trichonephila clavipes]|nr:uncharacterized protein TNCV_2880661 [Trichonephila clavipes]